MNKKVKTIAIMQPYFLPYIGYWQLINAVDTFVIYDNIKYTKKGWINRNRYLLNDSDSYFSISLKNDSDFLNVDQRAIAPSFQREKLLNKIRMAYRGAPYFEKTFDFFTRIIEHHEENLFKFILNSIVSTLEILEIQPNITISSNIGIDHNLRSQDKVIAICESLGAGLYINPIGGMQLYSELEFEARGIQLLFLKAKSLEYKQFGNAFIPWLSILDVMMFNSISEVKRMLNEYILVRQKSE